MECNIVSNPSKLMEQAVDCISSLPDEILHHILSHTEIKLAIRTSVLSKRWKHVWYETPSIKIDCSRSEHLIPINKTLNNYKAPKFKTFDLSIRYGVDTSHVDSWIELAMSRNTENLFLVFDTRYTLPVSFFNNQTVKQLSVRSGSNEIAPSTCIVSWTSLRSLSWLRCNPSEESIANILSGCPMLETLFLQQGSKLNHLDLSNSPPLTRLRIVSYQLLKIVAPQIRYLYLELIISPQLCVLEDISSLTEANFKIYYFTCGISVSEIDVLQDSVLQMLEKLQNVEKLTIGNVVLQILSLAELRGVTFPQFNVKHLTVETMVVRCFIPGIVRLLQNSPGLKKITIRTTKLRAIPVEDLDKYLNTQGLNPDHCWSEKYRVFGKVDAESKHVASLIELVLRSTKTLETMVLRLEGYLSATEYQKLLPMLPTVSSQSKKKNIRDCGQGKAILKSFKITP